MQEKDSRSPMIMYKLDENRNVVPFESDLGKDQKGWVEESRQAWDIGRRRVGDDDLGSYRVSTVFLPGPCGLPGEKSTFFETMVFDKAKERGSSVVFHGAEMCWRYRTWDEAEKGHEKVLQLLRRAMAPHIASPFEGMEKISEILTWKRAREHAVPAHKRYDHWETVGRRRIDHGTDRRMIR